MINDAVNLTIENFNKNELIITTANTGMKPAKLFNRVYCRHCDKYILPKLLEDYKIHLRENQNIRRLISKFGDLNIPAALHDIAGCFIALHPKVIAGPNARRFLERPTEHAKTTHPKASSDSLKKAYLKHSAKVQSLLGKPVPPKKVVVIEKPTLPSDKAQPSSSQCTLTLKYAKKMPFKAITTYMPEKKIPVTGECMNPTEAFNKNYCLSSIHHGINASLMRQF